MEELGQNSYKVLVAATLLMIVITIIAELFFLVVVFAVAIKSILLADMENIYICLVASAVAYLSMLDVCVWLH